MVEFEEPPLIPKKLRVSMEQEKHIPVNMEAELLRLKNEPYKRRRSRKSFEKVDIIAPLRRQAPHVCVICYEMFPDTSKLRLHMRQHHDELTFNCKSCDYVADSKATLVRHVKMLHETSPRLSTESQDGDVDSQRSDSSPPNSDFTSLIKFKKEPNSENGSELGSQNIHAKEEDSKNVSEVEIIPKNEASDEVVEKDEIVDVVSIKKEEAEDLHNDSIVTPVEAVNNLKENSNGESNNTSAAIGDEVEEHDKVKEETFNAESPKENEAPEHVICVSKPSAVTANSRPTTPLTPINGQVDGKMDSDSDGVVLDGKTEKHSPKYCKQCDISFMYLSSFIAHKKYYCNSHSNEKHVALTEVK